MMTDNEIIKAFECCEANEGIRPNCKKCPYFWLEEKPVDCHKQVRKNAIDLINRQQAEIERLEERILEVQRCDQELIETLHKIHEEKEKTAKSEAVKEFAERLCDDRLSNDPVVITVKAELKEMVGDNNAE